MIHTPFAHPVYVMAKPAGPACNLRCSYCYYLEKSELYPGRRTEMSLDTLELYIKQYIEAQNTSEVLFTWHGGEAMLQPLDFYRKAVELQRKYGAGRRIDNSIQTNGTLLTPEWCEFLASEGWLVGLSIDGPQPVHDRYRRTAAGEPTHNRVMRAMKMLQRYRVEWNALAVVNDMNSRAPREFYNFFRRIGCRFIQFTPIVERDGQGGVTIESVDPKQWGEFLCQVFDLWVARDVGSTFVQLFDSTLANWVGLPPGVCTMAATCGHAAALEHNGDLYCCDHFVSPQHKLGNIHEHTILEMMLSEKQNAFGRAKHDGLSEKCRRCDWRFACHGECPKNRLQSDAPNYLCEGYRMFFAHVAPAMDFMAARLREGRPPALIMKQPHLWK